METIKNIEELLKQITYIGPAEPARLASRAMVLLADLRAYAERLEKRVAAQQAKIDALMLEHCPDEMTPEQIEEWGRHQRPVTVPERTTKG